MQLQENESWLRQQNTQPNEINKAKDKIINPDKNMKQKIMKDAENNRKQRMKR